MIEDPVVAKIESKIYRGTYKDPLKKEESPSKEIEETLEN